MPRKVKEVETMNNETMNNEVIADTVQTNTNDILSTIARQMYNDLHIDDDDFYTTIAKKDGTSVEVVKQVFKFKEPIGNRNQLTVMDRDMIESIKIIEGAITVNKRSSYIICKQLSKIKESGKLENMGFKTIGEFAKALFGIESSTANHYAKIGELFITDTYEVDPILPQLSVSHLLELDTFGSAEEVSGLYQKGILSDGMSTKKIREVLKSLRENAIEDKGGNDENSNGNSTVDTSDNSTVSTTDNSSSNSDNASQSSSADPTTESVEQLSASFDKQIVVGKMLNYCDVIEQLFGLLKEHDIEVVDYTTPIESIKAMVQALL